LQTDPLAGDIRVPESNTFIYDSKLEAVREAIEAAADRPDLAAALEALAGIRRHLEQYVRLTEERMAALARERQEQGEVVSDTDHPRTVDGLARAFDRMGQGVADEDASLSTDPDDYPLF
jgi:hypothetical protein